MDLFDHQVNKMQNEILNIKSNLKSVKSQNAQAMHTIINSLQSLSNKNKNEPKRIKSRCVVTQQGNFKGMLTRQYNPTKYNKNSINRNSIIDQRINQNYNDQLSERPKSKIASKQQSSISPMISTINYSDYQRESNYKSKYPTENSNQIMNSNSTDIIKYSGKEFDNNINNNNQNDNINYKEIVNAIVVLMWENVDNETTVDNLVEKLKMYFYIQKENDNLVSNIANIYYNNNTNNDNISPSELLNWIKKNAESQFYKDFCDEIMGKFKIRSFENFTALIQDSLEYKNKNEKFVIDMKKLLCEEYSKKIFYTSSPQSSSHQTNQNNNAQITIRNIGENNV